MSVDTYYIVNVGGKATRMGPWAPAPKPFLGVGPWDADSEEGNGPCCAWRWLYWLAKAARPLRQRVALVLAIGYRPDPQVYAKLWELHQHFPTVQIIPDMDAGAGSLGGMYAVGSVANVVLCNGDDLLPGKVIEQFLLEAHHRFDANESLLAAAFGVAQSNEFGVIVPATTGAPLKVEEKPLSGVYDVGCGMLALCSKHVDLAEQWQSKTSSDLINKLGAMRLAETRNRIVPFMLPGEQWATLTDPARYVAACAATQWKDEAYEYWRKGTQTVVAD